MVPSCDFSKDDVLLAYDQLNVTQSDADILGQLCETIIPSEENIKGADDLRIKDFILVMMNDCYSDKDQESFTKGLKNFRSFTREVYGKSFRNMYENESTQLVMEILDGNVDATGMKDTEDYALEDINFLVKETKQLTIQGFMVSEYIMTGIMPYELVPGGFKGKVKIQEGEKVNIYG